MLNLVIHSLKSKKNWFLLNLAITVIITIIMPTLFRDNYGFFSAFTMFITTGLILISNFRELSFLHDDRKISYYLSKPISMMNKVNVALISNIIFTTVVFLLTFAISSFAGAIFSANALEKFEYLDFINNNLSFVDTMYASLIILNFAIILSSILTGNGTVSVFVTMFNYAIPIILLLIITFVCNIIDNTIIGMSTEAMIQSFVDKFLPIDKIYFFDYASRKAIDIFYFLRLIAYFVVTYILTIFAVKTRRNERTGDFVIHNGFKYFMSIFASLLLPMFVTSNMRNYDIITIVTVLVLLSALSYYILISAFNRSFKISKQALQIYIPFIIIFAASIFISSAVLKVRATFIPDASDVKAVYVGSNTSYLKNAKYLQATDDKWDSLIKAKYDEIKDNDSLIILEEKDSIKKVSKLQQALIDKKEERYYRDFKIIYFLNNGKKVVRTYAMPYDYEEDYVKNEIIDIVRTEEFIQKKFKVFCDENYINNVKFKNVFVFRNDTQHELVDFNYKEFAKLYMEDYREFINNDENINEINTNIISEQNSFIYDFIKKNAEDGNIEKRGYDDENTVHFEHEVRDGISLQYVVLPDKFTKTIMFIKSLK